MCWAHIWIDLSLGSKCFLLYLGEITDGFEDHFRPPHRIPSSQDTSQYAFLKNDWFLILLSVMIGSQFSLLWLVLSSFLCYDWFSVHLSAMVGSQFSPLLSWPFISFFNVISFLHSYLMFYSSLSSSDLLRIPPLRWRLKIFAITKPSEDLSFQLSP